MDAFHKDNQVTSDRWMAVFCMYLGYRLIRIETPIRRQDKNDIKYTLSVPALDWDVCQKEFADSETSILRKAFCDKSNILQSYVNRAFSTGGVWSCFEARELRRLCH